jgi:actin-related protein
MFQGFAERLQKELTILATKEMTTLAAKEFNVKVINDPERKYLSWRGAASFARKSEFNKVSYLVD